MELLHWETHNSTTFNVFIRDLSMSLKVNLKHMIEDMESEPVVLAAPDDKVKGKGKGKGKKVHIKKKDLIIQSQNKLREVARDEADLKTIDFLFKNLNDDNIYDNFSSLKSDKGKQIYKLRLLCYFVEKQKHKKKEEKKQKVTTDYMPHILNLYFNIKYGGESLLLESDEFVKMSVKLEKKLENYDYKTYMMKELSHLLPPLNFWDRGSMKLDDWQIDVITSIKNNKSVIVRAPTSSGKTFVAMAAGLIHSRILYVCPAKPVAYQVGANFVKMGYKVHYLVKNMGHLSYDARTNIFIGTPDIIEKYLPKIYVKFDYAVFDEIHNVSDLDTGTCYENIIKFLPCNFLALSATIENIDYLRSIFSRIHCHKEIEYVEYKKRFINQQHWAYGSGSVLNKVHPISCLDVNDFASFGNIAFTPNDCVVLYERLEEEFDDFYEGEDEDDAVMNFSPDEYFTEDKLLTLDDTKSYESFLKNKIALMYADHPVEIRRVISSFKAEEVVAQDNLDDIIPLFRSCMKKDLLPMLYFHTEEVVAQEIFMKVYQYLQDQEEHDYPFHYVILEKKDDKYKKYLEKRSHFSDSVKIKTKDARNEKQDKMNTYDKEQRDCYITEMGDFYQKCIMKCEVFTPDRMVKCIHNLKKELKAFLSEPDFREQDIFKKHPGYCFTRGEPMSGQDIRDIRREIKQAINLTIPYENPVFQLLKRGIGLYISSMPDEYNWILQRLMSERKLGIIISDRTLCLGIDLPIRSVALSGYKNPTYTTSDYLQMSGRAGRRGHDNQGNLIFHGIPEYLGLMKGVLPELTGCDIKLGPSYHIINVMNKNIPLHNLSWRINDKALGHTDIVPDLDPKIWKLAWNMRYYEGSMSFLVSMCKMEKRMFMIDEVDREYWLYQYIIAELFQLPEDEYLMIYKKNKIESDLDIILPQLIAIADVHRDIVNSLDNTFMITKKSSTLIFMNLRTLIYKYRGFE